MPTSRTRTRSARRPFETPPPRSAHSSSQQEPEHLSYVVYGSDIRLVEEIFASGQITCLSFTHTLHKTLAAKGTQSELSLSKSLERLSPNQHPREPAQDERERLHRSSPLQLVRELKTIAADHNLELFCALSFETAHIFEDLSLPDKPFALFLFAKTRPASLEELQTLFPQGQAPSFQLSEDTSPRFADHFKAAKEHFRVGDIFEIVLSRRFEFKSTSGSPYPALAAAMTGLQAPYRFALNFPGTQLVGASPELLVHVEGRKVTNRPISGSMRREKSGKELSAAEKETLKQLYASEKEKSELDMLVDLARHDLHRICNNVSVSAYREALILETVVHTQSTVTGTLREGYDALDAVFSCLNAGTLVGAPKKKAMEIIHNLEGRDREFYGGNLLHITPDGNIRATILIRSFQVQNERVTVQAGATVLHESKEDYEYWECGAKARGLLEFVGHGHLATGTGTPPAIDSRTGPGQDSFTYLRSFQEALQSGPPISPAGDRLRLRLLLIDNHDSFTFNLAALFEELGCDVVVVRNDMAMPPSDSFDACVLSPGPSSPRDAGHLIELTKAYWNALPLFGVCLGFQAMVEAKGGRLGVLPSPVHGKVRPVWNLSSSPLLQDLPERFSVGRYHSLYAQILPEGFEPLCEDETGCPMAFQARSGSFLHFGVQFHPESFLSGNHGPLLARNWLMEVARSRRRSQTSERRKHAEKLAQAILREEPSQSFLAGSLKGLCGETLAELVRILRREAALPEHLAAASALIRKSGSDVLDVCGTGGTKSHRLNTSTLTALFAATLGHCAVKHGGRSASGHKGSLDLLEHLGLKPEALFGNSAEHLRTLGLSFLGANFTYGSFGRYAQTRKAYGKASLFNLLGPLLNPAAPSFRLLGCFGAEVLPILADALAHLGEDGLVLFSEDEEGLLDEVNPLGVTSFALVRKGRTEFFEVSPLSLPPGEENNSFLSGTTDGQSKHRKAVFAEGLQAGQAVLNADDSAAGRLGRAFVLANLSVLSLLSGPYRHRGVFDQVEYEQLFTRLWTHFGTLAAKARAIAQSMATLKGSDNRSPLSGREKERVSDETLSRFESLRAPVSLGSRAKKLLDKRTGVFLAEIKIKTPLKGFAPIPLEEQVRLYEQAGADAISVVTHKAFDGSPELLTQVRSLTSLPILAKDFLSSAEDAFALIDAGADAVLVLEDWIGELGSKSLSHAILSRGALPVVESTWQIPASIKTLEAHALPLINARNLFTLELSERYRSELVRGESKAILASHISSPSQARIATLGHRGVLVGEALMSAGPKGAADFLARAGQATSPLLKACGAQNANDVTMAIGKGFDLVGLNLIPASRRALTPGALERLFSELSLKVDAGECSPWVWSQLVLLTDLSTPPEFLTWLSRLEPSRLKLLREQPYGPSLLRLVSPPQDAEAIRVVAPLGSPSPRPAHYGAELYILESGLPGSGQRTPYPKCPDADQNRPVLLAGGVSPATAAACLNEARAAGWWAVGFDAATHIARDSQIGFCETKLAELQKQALSLGALMMETEDDKSHTPV